MSKLELIDHTIEKLLQRGTTLSNTEIIDSLGKYPIRYAEVSVDTYCNNLEKMKIPFAIRVNLKLDEVFILENKTDFVLPESLVIKCKCSDIYCELEKIIVAGKMLCKKLSLCILDAAAITREDEERVRAYVCNYEIQSLVYSDIMGELDPFMARENLIRWKELFPCEIEFCAGNTCGFATANAIGALEAGVTRIHTVVGGIDMHMGAAMEEVMLAYKFFYYNDENMETKNLASDCKRILESINIQVPLDKAIIGENIFAHESGIHVDGIIKNTTLYEVIRPEDVGVSRKIIIGKYSGKASCLFKFREFGIVISEKEQEKILKEIKKIVQFQKTPISDEQLLMIYRRISTEEEMVAVSSQLEGRIEKIDCI